VTNTTAVAFVIDRPTAARVAGEMNDLGGAWREMFACWLKSHYSFLILLADTKERLRLRAPLTYMAVDEIALRQSLDDCCRRLVGRHCHWSLCLDKQSAAAHATREQLLIEFETEGNA
jgi:hypothetical protein